jgi:polyisoprenoid-binding protein YceI
MTTTTTTKTYAIDPKHTGVAFAVRHLMIAKVRGNFSDVSGTIELAPGSDIPTSIKAEIGAASVNTHEPDRDTHLRSPDFFDAEKHDKLSFVSTAITGSGSTFTATGDLTIHGVTNTVTFEGEVEGHTTDPWGLDRVAYSAKTKINRKDFGLTWNQALEAGGVAVGETVEITLDVQAVAPK